MKQNKELDTFKNMSVGVCDFTAFCMRTSPGSRNERIADHESVRSGHARKQATTPSARALLPVIEMARTWRAVDRLRAWTEQPSCVSGAGRDVIVVTASRAGFVEAISAFRRFRDGDENSEICRQDATWKPRQHIVSDDAQL